MKMLSWKNNSGMDHEPGRAGWRITDPAALTAPVLPFFCLLVSVDLLVLGIYTAKAE